MAALLAQPYSEEALAPGFAFSSDGVYTQPDAVSHEEYVQAIRELPITQSPIAFGLHDNAAITKDVKETRELFEAILSTQARAPPAASAS